MTTTNSQKTGAGHPSLRPGSPAKPVQFTARGKRSKLFESDAERFIRNRDEAEGYHRRATLFARDGMRASLVFNVSAVAIECYLIALCAFHRSMPSNHSYASLVADVSALMNFPPALAEGIRSLDRIFGICSLDDYFHGTPAQDDADQALALCESLHHLLLDLGELPEDGPSAA